MAAGRKTGGRRRGTPNKQTASVKAALAEAFDNLGGVDSMVAWAKSDPGAFYKLWVKLLPKEIVGDDGGPIRHAATGEHEFDPVAFAEFAADLERAGLAALLDDDDAECA